MFSVTLLEEGEGEADGRRKGGREGGEEVREGGVIGLHTSRWGSLYTIKVPEP